MHGLRLAQGFDFTERIEAPHRIAFKFAFELFYNSIDQSSEKILYQEQCCENNVPLAWSPDGRWLYHAADQIYAFNVAEGSRRRITDFTVPYSINFELHCTPDNRRLVFSVSNETGRCLPEHLPIPKGGSFDFRADTRLCSIGVDGSDFYAFEGGRFYRWWHTSSTDPHRVLFFSYNKQLKCCELCAVGPRGEERLTQGEVPAESGQHFVLAPDGRGLVYCYHDIEYEGLYFCELNNSEGIKISATGSQPAWSPQSDRVAFIDKQALWLWNRDTESTIELADLPGPSYSHLSNGLDQRSVPSWSPDGRFIAFWLSKRTKPLLDDNLGFNVDDIFNAHGIVDLKQKKVWLLKEGYMEHVAWQPLG